MLGFLASLVLSVLPAMPSASVTCAEGPASCDGAWPAAAAAEAGVPAELGDYATPAEVDCPTPAPGAVVVAGACDEAPPVDLWYRVSQDPDSERVAPTVAPARRAHGGRVAASCGTPPADPGHLTPPDVQPLALCAAPVLVLEDSPCAVVSASLTLPARVVAPLERPPRA